MKPRILIDESKCDGCGLCVEACHEGALAIVDGKAKMIREDYCDGMGDCLPACPMGALSFPDADPEPRHIPVMSSGDCSCPSSGTLTHSDGQSGRSELRQWPVKMRLVPESSPILKDADLLLIADCSAFAYAGTHEDFIKGRRVLMCCPKVDAGSIEKLTDILSKSEPKSLTVVRMSVPCCSLDRVAHGAVGASGLKIPLRTIIIDQKGSVKEGEPVP